MGNTNDPLSAGFQKRDDGKIIFHPYGKLGCGYVVSEDTEKRIKNGISIMLVVVAVITFLVYKFLRCSNVLVPIASVLILYIIAMKIILLGSEKIIEK